LPLDWSSKISCVCHVQRLKNFKRRRRGSSPSSSSFCHWVEAPSSLATPCS
jgi:hypothetical protein